VSRKTYAEAGVSLTAAEAVVERLRNAVESTGAKGFGAFAGLYPLDDERLLAASTDGVGTKLILLREGGRLRDGGRDLAAHCINDVLTTGATPLFLLDYVAANAIDLDDVAELVEGAADVCREARCALLGGETAELPGIYREEELDFAGTCVGIVDREAAVDGSKVQAGEPYDGPDLLAPTVLYQALVEELVGRADVHGFAHVTGGGILGNLSRVLPEGREAVIDWDAWERPTVFDWLARHVDEAELRNVFNLGIGFCAVVPADQAAGELVIGEIR